MSIVIVLQIATVLISILSIIINVTLTIKQNSIKHFLKYTTTFRMNNLLNIRNSMIALLNYTNPVIINSYSPNEYKDYLMSIYDASTEIELTFKDIYDEEKEMSELIGKLVKLSRKYFTDRENENLKHSIYGIRKKLKYLYSIYETTDWEFIKKQTYGKTMDNKEFLKTYDEYKLKFEELKRI